MNNVQSPSAESQFATLKVLYTFLTLLKPKKEHNIFVDI